METDYLEGRKEGRRKMKRIKIQRNKYREVTKINKQWSGENS